jgi:hypothetical protein
MNRSGGVMVSIVTSSAVTCFTDIQTSGSGIYLSLSVLCGAVVSNGKTIIIPEENN